MERSSIDEVHLSGKGGLSIDDRTSRDIIHIQIQADGKIVRGKDRIRELLQLNDQRAVTNIFQLLDLQNGTELFTNIERLAASKCSFWMKQLILNICESHKLDAIVHISHGEVPGYYVLLIYPLVELAHYKRLMEKAYTDELTQLPNFRKFKEDIVKQIGVSESAQSKFGLIFLDVDHFKQINDYRGHLIGDSTLQECAARLLEGVAGRNIVYRKSGDEFLIVVDNVNELEEIQMNIERVFLRLFTIRGNDFLVQISTGIAIYPDQGRTMEALIESSDRSLYQVKRIKSLLGKVFK